jgi:hypothetical protein
MRPSLGGPLLEEWLTRGAIDIAFEHDRPPRDATQCALHAAGGTQLAKIRGPACTKPKVMNSTSNRSQYGRPSVWT